MRLERVFGLCVVRLQTLSTARRRVLGRCPSCPCTSARDHRPQPTFFFQRDACLHFRRWCATGARLWVVRGASFGAERRPTPRSWSLSSLLLHVRAGPSDTADFIVRITLDPHFRRWCARGARLWALRRSYLGAEHCPTPRSWSLSLLPLQVRVGP